MTESLSTVLNFGVVVFILWYFGRKPISEFFMSRSSSIAAFANEAKAQSTQARQALDEWKAKNESAEQQIYDQFADSRAAMERYRQETLAKADAESRRIAEDAKITSAAESVRASRELQKHLVLESVERARQYLGTHVEKKDSQRLIQEYLENVSNGHPG